MRDIRLPPRVDVRAYADADLEAVVAVFTESVHQLAARDYSALQRAAWAPQAPALEPWARRTSSVTTRIAVDGTDAAFTEASLTARPFFERCGFLLTREEVVMRHGSALRRFAMRKSLRRE